MVVRKALSLSTSCSPSKFYSNFVLIIYQMLQNTTSFIHIFYHKQGKLRCDKKKRKKEKKKDIYHVYLKFYHVAGQICRIEETISHYRYLSARPFTPVTQTISLQPVSSASYNISSVSFFHFFFSVDISKIIFMYKNKTKMFHSCFLHFSPF